MEQFPGVVHDLEIMGGKACIKGTRVTVTMILTQISDGATLEKLLEDYPYLTREDVSQALKYAAWVVGAKEGAILSA